MDDGKTLDKGATATMKKAKDWLVVLVVICLMMAVAAGGRYATDAVLIAPWGYRVGGRPALTGTWLGTFGLPTGLDFALFLSLKHDGLSFGRPKLTGSIGAGIGGYASWCDSEGRQVLDVPLTGAVPLLSGYNASAPDFEMDVQNSVQPSIGLLPDVFIGSWHADGLVLWPKFSSGSGKAIGYARDNLDLAGPLVMLLYRADELAFRELCASLG